MYIHLDKILNFTDCSFTYDSSNFIWIGNL